MVGGQFLADYFENSSPGAWGMHINSLHIAPYAQWIMCIRQITTKFQVL